MSINSTALEGTRPFVEWLDVATEIVIQLQLKTIPHFTTLHKAQARISDRILHIAICRFIQILSPNKIFVGIDATGFKTRHATPYTIPIDAISGMHLPKCL